MDWTVNDWVEIITNLTFAICLLCVCVIASKGDEWENKNQRVDFIKSLILSGIAITIMSSIATNTDIAIKIVVAIIFFILSLIYRIKVKIPLKFTLFRVYYASFIILSTILITIVIYGIIDRLPFFNWMIKASVFLGLLIYAQNHLTK